MAGNWLRQNKYCSPLDNTPVIQINKYYLSTYCVHNTSSKQSISASGHVVGQETQAKRGMDRKAEAPDSEIRRNICFTSARLKVL